MLKNINKPQAGFTMVEVIVALAIMGISFMAIFAVMRTCLLAANHSRKLSESVILAESLISEVKLREQISFGAENGENDSFNWQIQIAPTEVENLGAVCVKVFWQEQMRKQEYELLSLVYIKPMMEGQ